MNAPPAAKPVSGETRHLGAAADLHQTGSLRITAAGSSFVSVASTNRKPLASQIGRPVACNYAQGPDAGNPGPGLCSAMRPGSDAARPASGTTHRSSTSASWLRVLFRQH